MTIRRQIAESESRNRILFVDDEPRVLDALRRTLRPMHHRWDMHFASSGAEALEMGAAKPFAVVVTDMRMPGMNGAELLQEVRRRWPGTVRFILSGHADRDMILETVGPTHRFFTKPCDPDLLVDAISRALATLSAMDGARVGPLVSGTVTLPAVPELYSQLKDLLSRPETTIEQTASVVSRDVAMSAKILHVANSSFFGPRREIRSIDEALRYLGRETVKSIVLTTGVFDQLPENLMARFNIRELEIHSMRVGSLAGQIVWTIEPGNRAMIDDSVTAGLLHDVGKLVLVAAMQDAYGRTYRRSQEEDTSLHVVEEADLHTTHAEVGGYLAELWDLPVQIVDAISCHHDPGRSLDDSFNVLTAVHVANVLVHEASDTGAATTPPRLDLSYLTSILNMDRIEEWRRLAN